MISAFFSRKAIWAFIILVVLGLGIAHFFWADHFWTQVLVFMQKHFAFTASVFAITLALVVVAVSRARNDDETSVPSAITAVILVIAAAAAVIYGFFFGGYFQAQKYSAAIETGSESEIDFTARTPYPVAVRSSQNALGNLTGGEIDNVKYTASEDGDEYTFLVQDRAFFAGYKAVASLDGSRCDVDQSVADRRVGGWFGNKLERLLNKQERGVYVSASDVYGYCDEDGNPMIVLPLKQVEGLLPSYEVPAGAAIYNGSTGELSIDKNVELGEIPGPVYPQSIAAEERNSLRATGSWWEYMRNLVGYNTTDNDGEDPNAGNTSEYGLIDIDGEGHYVTPLVSNGGSTAITALGIVNYGTNNDGVLNPYQVSVYESAQVSNGQAASVIRATFSNLSWQNGMSIFEITPTEGNKRVATLGLNQAIQYRVIFDNESYCLYDAKGAEISCTNLNEVGEAEGTAGTIAGIDISTLTDEELINLITGAAAEQSSRLNNQN